MAKVLISLPDEMLHRIDAEARHRNETRSGLFRLAMERELGWPDRSVIDGAIQRGRAAIAELNFDSAEALRRSRNELDERDRRR